MPTTLIAVSGMSPAILTETLWALAHEKRAVIPDEVIVITTSKGEADIRRDLLTQNDAWGGRTVWETLRANLLALTKLPKRSVKLQLAIRVIDLPDDTGIRQPAEDLRTKNHHEEAANFIIQNLAPLCDAADQHVIASIAGGRKTMGALLYAGMSLIGKESDRVTHVLVNEPFDSVRGFFYPDQPPQEIEARLHGRDPFTVRAKDARIDLADIPFVPLRNKFADLNEPRRTFAGLVETYARAERPISGLPTVTLDASASTITVNGRSLNLEGRELAVCAFLLDRAKRGEKTIAVQGDAVEPLNAFLKEWRKQHVQLPHVCRIADKLDAGDIARVLSELRKKLSSKGLSAAISHLAPPRGRIGFDIA